MRGLFVTFEGIEGSGKTTQVAKLAERLRACGREVVVVREPGGTPLAEEARRLVLDPSLKPGPVAEVFLYLVARADLVGKVVGPALERGVLVLADRFDLSTRAYQIGGRRLPERPVLEANALATGGSSRTWSSSWISPRRSGRSASGRPGRSGTGWSWRTRPSTGGSRRPFARLGAVPSFIFGRTGLPRTCTRMCGTRSLGGSRRPSHRVWGKRLRPMRIDP